jgi:hypothetical protein
METRHLKKPIVLESPFVAHDRRRTAQVASCQFATQQRPAHRPEACLHVLIRRSRTGSRPLSGGGGEKKNEFVWRCNASQATWSVDGSTTRGEQWCRKASKGEPLSERVRPDGAHTPNANRRWWPTYRAPPPIDTCRRTVGSARELAADGGACGSPGLSEISQRGHDRCETTYAAWLMGSAVCRSTRKASTISDRTGRVRPSSPWSSSGAPWSDQSTQCECGSNWKTTSCARDAMASVPWF